jgi:hypothetical protein
MAEAEPAAAAANGRSSMASVKLPAFWAGSPSAWFRSVEAQFMTKNITDGLEKYYLVLAALGEAQVDRVDKVLQDEPDEASYQKLKDCLLATHTLTPFQMVDRIVNMESLGGRKPTELLAAMNKLRPKDDYHFFAYHFLQRMPRELRVSLARDCCKDMQALAEKADELMALHLPQQHDITAVAPVTAEAAQPVGDEDDLVAAVQSKGGKGKKKKGFKSSTRGSCKRS